MSPARIRTRRTEKGEPRYIVLYRMGGRAFPELTAGTFRTLKDARARRDLIAGEIANGRDPRILLRQLAETPVQTRTLNDAFAAYQASRIDMTAKRRYHIQSHWRRISPVVGHIDPQAASTRDVERVVQALGDLEPATVHAYMATLRLTLDHAKVDPNPARDKAVKLPRLTHVELQPPTAAHFLRVLERMPRRMLLPMILMEQTAMAVGETEALEWGDVDVIDSQLRLRRENVKGRIRARARWVQVPVWLMELIEDTCPLEDRTPVRRVFRGMKASTLRGAMKRECVKVGVPDFSPHDLRHRRISLWHMQGVPGKESAARAGHSKASMTIDTYSHVLLDRTEANVEEIVNLVRTRCGLERR